MRLRGGAIDLYRGELLEGIQMRDSTGFDAWLLAERARLRAVYASGLEDRLRHHQQLQDAEATEQTARKLLELDNLREDWQRALMRAFAWQGKYTAALAQYELCFQILQQELDMQPAPETAELAAAIAEEKARHSVLAAQAAARSDEISLRRLDPPRPPAEDGRSKATDGGGRAAALAILALFALLLLVAVGAGDALSELGSAGNRVAPAGAGDALAGRTVTIALPLGDEGLNLFERSMAPFAEETGIMIEMGAFQGDLERVLPSLVDSGLAPDIVSIAQPGLIADFARRGQVVDVRAFLDEAYLSQQYSPALLQAAQVDGRPAGVWHRNNVKSLVWYPKAAFAREGYNVPQTWDELMALSARIAAGGTAPWCIGIESGAATGWVGTDWVEDILLRTAPPETYDGWIAGERPFDSPEVRRAFTIMAAIWRDEALVRGGTEAILSTSFVQSMAPLLDDPPGCYLHKQGSFLVPFFPEEAVFGQDYDFFYLPPIDAAYGKPVLGGGDMMVMFNDRPEVRAVMRYLTTADSVRYFVEEGGAISPHRDTPFEWYASAAQLRMAQILLEADTYRFDGSDAMPPEVGAGSFWQGMVDWTAGADTGDVLRAIDQSWP
jgi:alpha-glucoside transport system substrate-binding protein